MHKSTLAAGLAAILLASAMSLAGEDAFTLPAGSELDVEMITTLSSKTNDTGDMWTAKVVVPVFGKGGEIVPEGSTVDGHITFVKIPGQKKGKGEMQLIADSISTPDRSKYNIAANLEHTQAPQVNNAQDTGILAAVARKFSRKGKNIEITPGTEVVFPVSRNTVANKVPVRQ